MALKNLADKLYSTFMKNFPNESSEVCKIFLSASDMKTRAVVRNASAPSPKEAWEIALEELKKILKSEKIDPVILRADWVISSEKITWENFIKLVEDTRRNYFRKGLALDSDYKIAFTEMEMNGNAMLYQGGKEGSAYGVFRQNRSDTYCQKRFGMDFPTPSPTDTVEIFETQGAFIQENEEPKFITGKGIYAGRRDTSTIDSELFMTLAKNGAKYLAGQVQKSGKFIYGYHTCFHNQIKTYNTLRHMSSTFAMLDVYGAYKKMPPIKLGKAIINAVEYAVKKFISYRTLDDGTRAAYLADPFSEEIKLGGNGVSLLALVKYTELMHTKKYLPLMKELANGILSMQNPDGSFVHVLNTSDFSVKEPFRIVYYDGEAVFGMLRLYSITKDEKLLQASVLAFERFIKTNHWRNHDHWLSYAVNELTSYKPEAKYFEFGINNFLGFLSFIYHRDTQFPTLMELMMAADTMLERLKTMPEMSELLQRVNFNDFYAALEKRAENLLNGYFWPELAMYFAKPEVIAGSFFIRHHAFRVRIDDVEHYLSGFVAYCRYLERRKNLPAPVPTQKLLGGKAEGTGIFNIQSTEVTPESNEEKKNESPAISLSDTGIETAEKINLQIDNSAEIDVENFKEKFKMSNSEVFFMLRNIKKNAAGLELSAFHRVKIFKKYLGINVCLVTNEYQTDIRENLEHYNLDVNYLNLYEYFQITEKKVQSSTETIYYRSDCTMAMRETYELVEDKNSLINIELFDQNKNLINSFPSKEELTSHWVRLVLNDKKKNYFLIGDRPAEYARTYMDIKSAGTENIHVFHQIHNIHYTEVKEGSETRIVSRYRYLTSNKIKVDGIISLTQRQKSDIIKQYNLNDIFVIPHALKNFPPSNVERDLFKIILIGRLGNQKDQLTAVEVFKIVSQTVPQAHLHFYGSGPLKREIQGKVNLYGLQDKVFFEGFVTNMTDVYGSAALSLCTSKYEGFSMANQESLQLGCPVVSFDCLYGPSDMIEDGVNGFLVPEGDVKAMAQKIILILQNSELQKKLSENAPKTMEKYSQSVVAKQWATLFSKFLPKSESLSAGEKISVFYGGDVNIGRRMHRKINEVEQFVDIDEMSSADLRVVNLECVIANKGGQGVDKGEGGPYYFHARPEQINILTKANIDIVLTANNHTGDYGGEALLEEEKYLDAAGILHTGSGKNFSDAIKPIYKKVKNLVIAIFSVDATMKPFASSEDMPGTAFISLKQPEVWKSVFEKEIPVAREKADVVIVAPHWGVNGTTKNSDGMKNIGHMLIDLGADAVLGCHSHMLHGVENYKSRPIVYDAGDFLFDATTKGKGGGCFTLEISSRGIEKVKFVPLNVCYGYTKRVHEGKAKEINKNFVELCNEFNLPTFFADDETVEIQFNPPPREKIADIICKPLEEPLKEWTTEKVPDEAKIEPQNFGPLKLIGCKVSPTSMTKRQMIFVETYWTIDNPIDQNFKFDIVGIPQPSDIMPKFGAGMWHEGCDWMWPTNRWKSGTIYYERFGLRPPQRKDLKSCTVQIEIRVQSEKEILGLYVDKTLIALNFPA